VNIKTKDINKGLYKMIRETVQTYKIPILKPVSTDWKTFGKVAGDISYNLIKVMNDAMTMNYVNIQEKYDYKNEKGKKFNVEEQYGVKLYTRVINRKLKEKYKGCNIPADLLEQAVRESLNVFKTNSKEVLKGNASLMVFRRDQPIPVRG